MGIFDKIIDGMHLNNEDDDFDDDYDYEDDDFDEPKVKKPLFGKKKDKDFDYDLPEEPAESKQQARIAPVRPKKTGAGMAVCVFKPTSFDEAREITDTLLSNRTIVINFEGLDVEIAQRIIDFTSGSCYAIDGNLQKVSNYIFVVTPKNVDISGDFQDILAGAFDVASI